MMVVLAHGNWAEGTELGVDVVLQGVERLAAGRDGTWMLLA